MIRINLLFSITSITIALAAAAPSPLPAAQFQWVPVGNVNNPADASFGDPSGAVAHRYRIGKYEITNSQYAEFLNLKATHVAGGDDLALYNPRMQTDARLGISRTGAGTPGDPYVYIVKPNMDDKAVGMVSVIDAMRFANWVHNGQAAADTETGAYALLGGTAVPTNSATIARNPQARVFLPSKDEWHKAAYYEPGASGDSYWKYATRSDVAPVKAIADAAGNVANPGANVVNYDYNAAWNGAFGNVTTVGGAGPLSESYYGAADMTGNQFEATESHGEVFDSFVFKGGSWADGDVFQWSNQRPTLGPDYEDPAIGFRLASIPEPLTSHLTIIAALVIGRRTAWPRRRQVLITGRGMDGVAGGLETYSRSRMRS